MYRPFLLVLVCALTAVSPAPTHAAEVCEEVIVDSPVVHIIVRRCVDLGTGALCITVSTNRPPAPYSVRVCIPYFPLD